MIIENIKYSKCPHCAKHGIRGFGKMTRVSKSVVSCRFCEKIFRVNTGVLLAVNILLPLLCAVAGVLFNRFCVQLPLGVWVALFLAIRAAAEYFAPLEEVEL